MKWPFIDGHCIPPEEVGEHITEEWCECRPIPINDPGNVIWWRHNRFDNTTDLLEAAEALKAAESVKLHQNAELKGGKLQVYPYGMKKIQLPRIGHRKEIQ